MMPAKLRCDHAEDFESGLRALGAGCRRMGTCVRNCFGRCSQIHSDDEPGTDYSWGTTCSWVHMPTVPLFEQLCCNGVTLPKTLEQILQCQLELEQVRMMTTGCKSTLSRKARGKGKGKHQKPERQPHEQHKQHEQYRHQTRARTAAELHIGRKGLLETHQ